MLRMIEMFGLMSGFKKPMEVNRSGAFKKIILYSATNGEAVQDVIQKILNFANKQETDVMTVFKDTPIIVHPGDNPEIIYRCWKKEQASPAKEIIVLRV